jgi:uncharacterized RDD family membrane protein YckC
MAEMAGRSSVAQRKRFETIMSPPPRPLDFRQPPLPPGVHLVIDGADFGPVDPELLLRLAADGRIGPETLAWHPSLDAWTEIARLPEIAWALEGPTAATAGPAPLATAGLIVRLAAGAVDVAVWLGLVGLMSVPLGLMPILSGASDDSDLARRFDLLAQGTAAVYYVLPMSRIGGGATIGYRLFGLRLVAARDLRAPGVFQTFVWYIVTYLRLIGWLTYFFDSKRRMLHNIVSNTLVIVARGRGA